MPDGETFVMLATIEKETVPPVIVVVQNWIREFRDAN
jgi:hypothetical protein